MDYVFFSNNRRWEKYSGDIHGKVIATSNIERKRVDYCIDYNSLKRYLGKDNNGLLMLLNLLRELNIHHAAIAGADGYGMNENSYYSQGMRSYLKRDREYNREVAIIIRKIGVDVRYITPSEYEKHLAITDEW